MTKRQKWRDTLDKESPIQAGCSNRACPDLRGGCPVMRIPTAILDPERSFSVNPTLAARWRMSCIQRL
jgi:hypothetical protein